MNFCTPKETDVSALRRILKESQPILCHVHPNDPAKKACERVERLIIDDLNADSLIQISTVAHDAMISVASYTLDTKIEESARSLSSQFDKLLHSWL